jgi:hypothetical protein
MNAHIVTVLVAALTLLMSAAGIRIADDAQIVIFRTPTFLVTAAAMGFFCIAACARYGRSWRRVPFWMVHLGVVLVLLGAAMGKALAIRGQIALPVTPHHAIDRLTSGPEGSSDEMLGFSMSVTNFEVRFYPPTYRYYRPRVSDPRTPDDYEYIREYAITDDGEPIDELAQLADRTMLWDPHHEDWMPLVRIPDGSLLQQAPRTPKDFAASLMITQDGRSTTQIVRVNQPHSIDGWRIYLDSYGLEPMTYVNLQVRRDPGRRFVLAGIWMLITGTTILCWRPRRAC